MQPQPRTLHHLEKIIVVFALAFALALTIGFAQAAGPKRKAQPLPADDGEHLFLRSSVALVQDASSGGTVFAKNTGAVLPIASITKLMTALVLLDANVDLNQRVAVSGEDLDFLKGTRSKLRPGAVLTRDELLLLALMASENRAASALARTYPGGTDACGRAMYA